MTTVRDLIATSRKHYNNPLAPSHINVHNQKKWVRSVLFLGDNWLLAKRIERKM